jgi:quercetin dioxygenase-like cupin family protein
VTYFRRDDRTGVSTGKPLFVSVEREVTEVEAAPGVWMRPVFGEMLNLSFVRMEPNSEAPVHEHAEEQIGVVLFGSCEFTLGDETRTLRAGDVYVAPPWVPHGAATRDGECRILDAFSPPREALKELMERSRRSPDTTT